MLCLVGEEEVEGGEVGRWEKKIREISEKWRKIKIIW